METVSQVIQLAQDCREAVERKNDVLFLADGSSWTVEAGEEQSAWIASRFQDVMNMGPGHTYSHRIAVFISRKDKTAGDDLPVIRNEDDFSVSVRVNSPVDGSDRLAYYLWQISLVIAHHAEMTGGLLIHGALAEWQGRGVILAGPGGNGKTTASMRLASPWRSLSDDCTLVLPDGRGGYWAHPWPTWSSFMSGNPGSIWDVQHAVPLKSIFFLSRRREDSIVPLSDAQAICMLVESAEQASAPMSWFPDSEARELRLQRFRNICSLRTAVPSYLFYTSLEGMFWKEIEETLPNEKIR